jgi:hypothetical protein
MSAVDQNAQSNPLWTAEVEKPIHGGTDGASRVEHVIDDYQIATVYREADFRGLHHGLRRHGGEIVAVKSDVERADRDIYFRKAENRSRQALRERHSAPAHADQSEIFGAAAFLDDFVRDSLERAIDLFG